MRKHFKPSKQVFSFRKESSTTTLTKSKPCGHVFSCLAMFNDFLMARREVEVCISKNCGLFLLSWAFLLDRALYAITFSVLDKGVTYLWPWV